MRVLLLIVLLVTPVPLAAQGRWDARDAEIFAARVRWGVKERLDTLPLGEAVVRVGLTFVGTPYQAQSLEQPGPEQVVVNFRGLDCVTFVETVLALTRFIRQDGVALLATPENAHQRYEEYLKALRYRGGVVDGYASRLHYFSEWISEGVAAGRLTLVTPQLGGIPTWLGINFISTHAGAYPALRDTTLITRIVAVESHLSDEGPVAILPKGWITPEVAVAIRPGDIIAMAATIPGLDIVHVGFAVRKDGEVHLLHAPLAGGNVEVSERPLAQRLLRLKGQAGIIVARPHDPT